MEQMPNSTNSNVENIRSEQEINIIINEAISEVIETFRDDMSEQDRKMLESVAKEEDRGPKSRILRLHHTQEAFGVSDDIKGYINQILLTLREQLTPEEQEEFRGWGAGQNLLNDIL